MNKAVLLLVVLISACQKKSIPSAQETFFDNLSNLCGQVFTGASTYPDDPDHDFAGKLLIANFSSCSVDEIRVKFKVGQDQSRTWIITQSEQGLLLKHDHRHADGTPDEITNYGGWANNQGNSWRQFFVADSETAELIPAAATNVWMLEYQPRSQILTYDLKRHDQPRYQAQLHPKQ
ncbi:MAG: hypothetical protein R3E90_06990 [Marinicella sp.]|nr:hypothetical protein [Xanthomonadales bacterium]